MSGRQYLLLCTVLSGFLLITKVLQVALTAEAWRSVSTFGQDLHESSAVGFLLVMTAILFLLSLVAAAWDRAERRWEAAHRPAGPVAHPTDLPSSSDPSSLIDDTPRGPLPETWRAPCGEVVRLNPTSHDRGPRAA